MSTFKGTPGPWTPNTVKNHRAHAIKSIQSFIKNKVK